MEKVNELLPNNAEVIRVIGWSHIMLGKMEKGMALLRRAYAISPNDEQIIHNLNMAQLLFHEANWLYFCSKYHHSNMYFS